MPCRDRGKLVSETVESLLAQTIQDWELIVVDDHSSAEDNTEEVLKGFNDERIFYIKLDDKYGKGIASARNFGNMLAKSDYIAVVDSDDINFPDRLELTLKEFQNGADVVYGDIDLWFEDTGEVRKREKHQPQEFDIEEFKNCDFIPNMTVAYRKKIAFDFPYNTFFRIAEDYDFLTRVAIAGYKMKFIDKTLVKARMHSASITGKKDFEFNYGRVVKHCRGWIDERPEIFGR